MANFILDGLLWVLAMYGLIEIVRIIYSTYTYKNIKLKNTHVIITVKDEENLIEGFLRSFIPQILNNNQQYIDDLIITDLNSKDRTKEILTKLNYENVNVKTWQECKEIMDDIAKKE